MYFKRLEIQGFKSFADPTVIDFHEGVTCIVGPNGSGKSNISDAIRWVLGEQSPKTLRGSRMEEIIFSGTQNRKPKGFAEVSLIIDNSENLLDIDYNEVIVTRRMYRSGESEYLINGNNCRLRDIRNLILDTGIGIEGYSIIGQGRIADIISDKPENRRAIFEEAAGIASYRAKKNEAKTKLSASSNNLDRVNDIIAEIEDRIDGLRDDSIKAKKFLELKKQYNSFEINCIIRNVESNEEKKKQYTEEKDELEKRINELKTKNEKLAEKANANKSRKKQLEEDLEKINRELIYLEQSLNTLEKNAAIRDERRSVIDKNEQRINEECEDLEFRISELGKEIEEIQADIKNAERQTRDAEKSLSAEIEKYKDIVGESAKLSLLVDEGNNRIFELNSEAVSKRGEAKSYENYAETLRDRREQLEAKADEIELNIKKIEDDISCLRMKIEKTEDEIDCLIKENDEKTIKLQKANKDREEFIRSLKELTGEVERKTARFQAMEDIQSVYGDYRYAVRHIMQSNISGIMGTVGDAADAPAGYETAIETALGSAIQNIICDTDSTAKKAIDILKKDRSGRLTFLPIGSVTGRTVNVDREILEDSGCIGIASDIAKFNPVYKGIFTYLLGRTILTKNLNDAVRLSKKTNSSIRFVTLEGEIINAAGAVTGGRDRNNRSNILERRNELKNLEKEIRDSKIDVSSKKKRLEMLEYSCDKQNADLEKAIDHLSNRKLTLHDLNTKLANLENDLKNERSNREKNSSELIIIDKQTENADLEIKDMLSTSQEAEKEIARLTIEIANHERNIDDRKTEVERANEAITDCKIEVNQKNDKAGNLKEILKRIEKEAEGSDEQLKERKNLLENLNSEKQRLDEERKTDKIEIQNLKNRKIVAESRSKAILDDSVEHSKFQDQIDVEISGVSRELSACMDEKYKSEVSEARCDTRLDNLKDKLWDEFEMSLAEASEYRIEDISMTAASRESAILKKEIQKLGDVNVGAIDEYDSVNKRYGFLTTQRDDLIDAMKSLNEIIVEMDNLTVKKFKETFDLAASNFDEVFHSVFEGGRAELRMDDENNPLDSGIVIVAQPPGKKLQNLNLLSGGEKTMTAIAMMFAILKTKPTPFCILDEVEAALDDENIEKFSHYLINFKQTQFALITHQKATMEHADTIYGITMPEHGVSKVLSLKLGNYDPDDFTE